MPEWCLELPVLMMFFAAIGIVFGSALKCARAAHSAGWRKYKFTAAEISYLLIALFGLTCIAYGFAEPFSLTVTKNSFSSEHISDPIRIVHISDVHSDGWNRIEDRLPKLIADLKPDIIVFTGDAANNRRSVGNFNACMKKLTEIAPVFGVRGNNDLYKEVFENTGVQQLNASAALVSINGQSVWIGGVGVDQPERISVLMGKAPGDRFSIFLYHYPAAVLSPTLNNIDLLCAGHTHGGQVRMPLYGALMTNSQVGKKFEYGLYEVGRTHVFVSRGLGMIGVPVLLKWP